MQSCTRDAVVTQLLTALSQAARKKAVAEREHAESERKKAVAKREKAEQVLHS